MPEPKISDDDLADRLAGVFRQYGYDGATLSLLAEASGLGRASLYHRFPGGKREMAETVLARIDGIFMELVFAPLRADGPADRRIKRMFAALKSFYHDGRTSCAIDTMGVGEGGDLLLPRLKASVQLWIAELAAVIREATGLAPAKAKRRAEQAVIAIEGALVVARATGDIAVFGRTLRDAESGLLGP